MRPVLVSLGPWGYLALPVIFVVLYLLMLAWQWAEARWGEGKPLNAARAALTALPAAVLTVLVFLLVNRFAPVEIKSWGTMLVLAFAAGTVWLAKWGDKRVIKPPEALDLALFCLIGAIIGARLIFVALDWDQYAQNPGHLLNVWEGGLSFHGGLLGAILAGLLFARLRKINFWALADEVCPGIAIGYAIARIGCFLNGCCHGHPCNLPWAMVFPHGEINDRPVHPTQLYAMAASLVIFAILVKLRGKFPRAGHLFGAYLALYSIQRYLLEMTRAGATGKLLLPWLTVGQLASVLIFLVVVVIMALTWRAKPAQEAPQSGGGKHGSGPRR
ncbi:MAG: prolipoprotein diacylglyceryl transferase [Armatimonadia bacterium]